MALGLPADTNAAVTVSTRPEFGDYQINGAMAAAKLLKTNPRQLAEQLVQQLDLADIAALAAPKPLLILAGAQDPLIPKASVQAAFAQLQLLYQQCQSESQVTLQLFPEKGHIFDAQMQQLALAQLRRMADAVPLVGCQ